MKSPLWFQRKPKRGVNSRRELPFADPERSSGHFCEAKVSERLPERSSGYAKRKFETRSGCFCSANFRRAKVSRDTLRSKICELPKGVSRTTFRQLLCQFWRKKGRTRAYLELPNVVRAASFLQAMVVRQIDL